MKCIIYLLLAGMPFFAVTAQTTTANEHMNQRPFEELVKTLERADRASWQKPEEVIALFGTVKNKKIIDIGCGTGYFSFRLIDSGATVIAADIDERFLQYVDSIKLARGISDKKLQTRKLPPNDPLLQKREVDMVFIVNTYHHLEDRVNYLRKVKNGLKQQGYIVVIDYFKKELPMGPPVSVKLSADDVIRDLKMAGFSTFKTEDKLLPFQYIVFAL